MGWKSLEHRCDGNLLCNDQMAFPVFYVPQEDLPSRVIRCLNIHIPVRKKILYEIQAGLYLVFTSLFFDK